MTNSLLIADVEKNTNHKKEKSLVNKEALNKTEVNTKARKENIAKRKKPTLEIPKKAVTSTNKRRSTTKKQLPLEEVTNDHKPTALDWINFQKYARKLVSNDNVELKDLKEFKGLCDKALDYFKIDILGNIVEEGLYNISLINRHNSSLIAQKIDATLNTRGGQIFLTQRDKDLAFMEPLLNVASQERSVSYNYDDVSMSKLGLQMEYDPIFSFVFEFIYFLYTEEGLLVYIKGDSIFLLTDTYNHLLNNRLGITMDTLQTSLYDALVSNGFIIELSTLDTSVVVDGHELFNILNMFRGIKL